MVGGEVALDPAGHPFCRSVRILGRPVHGDGTLGGHGAPG
ncbi:hypothetical protein L083_5266 [Actinoplanes sp. N902-109]|nr:hypothetical protein L083_5266 [Actinoplanes sp. N902-109]